MYPGKNRSPLRLFAVVFDAFSIDGGVRLSREYDTYVHKWKKRRAEVKKQNFIRLNPTDAFLAEIDSPVHSIG